MKKVVITGFNGFLGSNFLIHLLTKGSFLFFDEIYLLDTNLNVNGAFKYNLLTSSLVRTLTEINNVSKIRTMKNLIDFVNQKQKINVKLLKELDLNSITEPFNFLTIYNFAATVGVESFEKNGSDNFSKDMEHTLNLYNQVKKLNPKVNLDLYMFGTGEFYDTSCRNKINENSLRKHPLRNLTLEDLMQNSRNNYSIAKIIELKLFHELCKEKHFSFKYIIPFNIVGAGQSIDKGILPKMCNFIRNKANGEKAELELRKDSTRGYTSVGHFCEQIIRNRDKEIIICAGNEKHIYTPEQLFKELLDVVEVDKIFKNKVLNKVKIVEKDELSNNREFYDNFNGTQIKNDLKNCYDWVDWYKENNREQDGKN